MKSTCNESIRTLRADEQLFNVEVHILNTQALAKESSPNLFLTIFHLVHSQIKNKSIIQKYSQHLRKQLFRGTLDVIINSVKKMNPGSSRIYNSRKEIARWLIKKNEYIKNCMQKYRDFTFVHLLNFLC